MLSGIDVVKDFVWFMKESFWTRVKTTLVVLSTALTILLLTPRYAVQRKCQLKIEVP